MELTPWLLCLSLSLPLLCVLSLAAKRRPYSKSRPPPGPAPIPFIGNLLELGDQPHRSLARLAKSHGPVMTLKLGLLTTVVVSSPGAACEALQKKDAPLSGRWIPDAATALGHHRHSMIWTPDRQTWKILRAISSHLFSVPSLDAGRDLRQQKVRELVAHVRAQAGRPVEVGRAVFGAVLNLVSNTLFSVDVVDLNSESTQEFKELVSTLTEEAGKPNLSDFFPFLRAIDPQGRRRRVTKYLRKLYKLFDELIDRRLSSESANGKTAQSNDFLEHLLRLHAKSKISRSNILSLLADLFAAGGDTSWITVEWAMAELLRHPGALGKARKELEDQMGSPNDVVEESAIARLPYLQAVVKEVLRLHPPGPLLLPHRAPEAGVELGEYAVPAGAQVVVNAWAIGRDETVWEEPEEFSPERFLGKEVDFRGRDFELIPFGAGRRACPGRPLAARMVHVVLAALLHNFEWRLPEGVGPADVDLAERFGATLAMAVPLRAVPVESFRLTQQTGIPC